MSFGGFGFFGVFFVCVCKKARPVFGEGVLEIKDNLSKVPKINKNFASVFNNDNRHRAKTSWVTEMNIWKQK